MLRNFDIRVLRAKILRQKRLEIGMESNRFHPVSYRLSQLPDSRFDEGLSAGCDIYLQGVIEGS